MWEVDESKEYCWEVKGIKLIIRIIMIRGKWMIVDSLKIKIKRFLKEMIWKWRSILTMTMRIRW